jgi:Inhibitor of Apoptosis domain
MAKFADENLRLRTFHPFKGDQHMVKTLVKCGFFLDNDDKRVCCFYCAVGFNADSSLTDFRAIHLKISPDCPFLDKIISQRERRRLMRSVKYHKPLTYFVRQIAPFNDQYVDCYTRIQSLPKRSTSRIARAGFYFGKHSYICYECGCNVPHFFDDPWKEHCALNPNCLHLLRSKGFYYIQKNL